GELVVAEPRLVRPGGHDQAVVAVGHLAPGGTGGQGAGVQVDVLDVTEHHRRVALGGEDVPGGRGDHALGEDAGRDLVEQRLEEVVPGAGHHRDRDGRVLEGLGGEQPAEAGPDDEDPVRGGSRKAHTVVNAVG